MTSGISSGDEPTRGMYVAASVLSALSMLLVLAGSIDDGVLALGTVPFLVFAALAVVGMWNADLALRGSRGTLRTLTAYCAGSCVLVVAFSPILLVAAEVAGAL